MSSWRGCASEPGLPHRELTSCPGSAGNLDHVLSHWPSLVPVAPADTSAGQVLLPTEGFDTAAGARVYLNTVEVQHLMGSSL